MDDADARAVEAARAETGAGADAPAQVLLVRRLDRPGGYRLVRLGEPGGPGWIAAVATDGLMSWARLASGADTVPDGPGELVWWASARTASALYPLRVVEQDGRATYLGLDGHRVPGPDEASGRRG